MIAHNSLKNHYQEFHLNKLLKFVNFNNSNYGISGQFNI